MADKKVTDDMLVSALIGKYLKQRLTSQTIVSDEMVLQVKLDDVNVIIKNQLATDMATAIIESKDQVEWVIGEQSPEYLGKKWRLRTYLFSEKELTKLIRDAFEMGKLASVERSDETT